MENLQKLSAQELCDAYRAELRRLYGDECADASRVDSSRGWYYISVAGRCGDGSYYTHGIASAYRKAKVIEMIEVLARRTSAC